MANTAYANNFSLQSILKKDKLNGTDFLDWYRNLRIVLKKERKLYVLEQPIPAPPIARAPHAKINAHRMHSDDALDVACLMLATMDSKLQKQHENMDAFDMLGHLKKLYEEQARHERYDVSKELFRCKLADGSPVKSYVLKMIRYVESLEKLDAPLGQELATNLIMQLLPSSYNQFVMNEIDKSLLELLSMLRTIDQNLNKAKPMDIMMIHKGKKK
ncbi:hypothetical protein L6164_008467 [Bauhinia variegata]|uniref:Uncharacterized protein n=1 Tax=Bauhinia variegata TaxID=167791 RepID=A0ACB9PGP5_BAUVA|nr:hypothetical protein L6164_008467 [Bauhinia variegata]